MSFLEKLQKTLYQRGGQATDRPHEPESLTPGESRQPAGLTSGWQTFEHRGLSQRQWRLFWRGVLAALFLIAVGGVSWYFQVTAFSLDKVVLSLEGPRSSFNGQPTDLIITIQNQNRSALEKAKLTLNLPQGTFDPENDQALDQQSFDLGTIEPGQTIKKQLSLRFLGPLEEVKQLSATLTFVPSSIESPISKRADFSVQIASAPVEVFLELPNEVVAGENFTVKVSYANVSELDFKDLKLHLIAPAGFQVQGTGGTGGGGLGLTGSVWTLASLAPQESGEVSLQGSLAGPEGARRDFRVELLHQGARIAQDMRPVRIVSAPLALDVTINGHRELVGRLGQRLSVKFLFTNNFNVALRDLRLETQLVGELFDFGSLRTEGDFDPLENKIVWGPAEGRQFQVLNPGESGEASFTIFLRNSFPVRSFQDKNFSVALKTTLVAESVPALLGIKRVEQKHTFEVPIESQLVLKTLGFYRETRVPLSNSGPIPPRVGQATTYTLHWQVINVGNDVRDVEISAQLPNWVDWTGVTWANRSADSLVYDSRLRMVYWRINEIPAGTGVVLPALEAAFQVKFIPAPNQRGQAVDLIGESRIQAVDAFTATSLQTFAPVVTTALKDDPSISRNQGVVQ